MMTRQEAIRGGLLVIRRGDWTDTRSIRSGEDSGLLIHPSNSEVLMKYRGIEGLPWPEEEGVDSLEVENGIAPIHKLRGVREYFQRVRDRYHVDFIAVFWPARNAPATISVPSGFRFLGYDYGVLASAYNSYSWLLNEVVWGELEELKSYSRFLNENLLFPNIEIVDNLHGLRRGLVERGMDLETEEEGEEFGPIMIFEPEEGEGNVNKGISH